MRSETWHRGSVLVTVLVVVVMLTLGAYTFTRVMLAELEATVMYERGVRTRAFADSGIELAAAVLGQPADEFTRPNLYDNPALFHRLMQDAAVPRGRGSFSIVAPRPNDNGTNPFRYGLIDESGKLNLNTLLTLTFRDEEQEAELESGVDPEEEAQLAALMMLPNMTADVAAAILDWLDQDDLPRPLGAENEFYGGLNPPYQTAGGPLESLDELLRVRGVTYELLHGEDVNRNGFLDANENDGDASPPLDNADGILDRGWSVYLTVLSREANRRADGEPKIDVNQDDLAALYDAVEQAFDSEAATFVTAYRLNGPDDDGEQDSDDDSGSGGRRRGGDEQDGGGSQTASGAESRGGLDLSDGGSHEITSLYQLVGASVTAEVNGARTTLESPWKDEPSSLAADLPTLLDRLTTSSEEFIEGRINIAQAPREVLLTIPGLEEQVIEAILGTQVTGGSAAFEPGGPRATTGWLLTEGLVDLEQMRDLDRYITSRGDVYRVQSVGYFDAGGPATRLEAIIDATQLPPRIVSVRDLSDLGRAYPLQPAQSGAPSGLP